MLNINDYKSKMEKVGFSLNEPILSKRFNQYKFYEEMWRAYFESIYLANYNSESRVVRLIILESCPDDDGIFPHPNYIFNNLNSPLSGTRDMYLHQPYRGFFSFFPVSKKEALQSLAKENVLVLDLMPSHGFKLTTKLRGGNINADIKGACEIDKVNSIIKSLNPEGINDVHICFGTPLKLDFELVSKELNGESFGSMTSSAGFPSFSLLKNLIHEGF